MQSALLPLPAERFPMIAVAIIPLTEIYVSDAMSLPAN